uniref:Macaca fascicularis brain cDNA clone: QflA-23444, similar to human nucleolar and coiled-body phosphoprotein 1 (NOLC1), mRNA, RefSeq: NM_004741.1 n=1 Tax=Macaca fascicularis TaxID=9541 RepID=I7GMS1_MACFA|nr:unnamed protein product [Macaca fascicularis]
MSVKHAVCISSSFIGSGTEVFSQHGPDLLFGIKFTVLLQAEFWCGMCHGVILNKFFFL